MHYHFVRTRTVCCLLALAAAVWSLGCRPPASPYGPGANATGANSTDADVDNDGIDDLSTATASNATDVAPADNVAAAGGGTALEPIAVGDNASTVAVAEGAGEAAPAYTADPLDWPYHRGPHSNNVSYETGLIDDWNPAGGEGSNVRWSRDDLGTRSTPIVMNGKLYTLTRSFPGTAKEGERVICVDAATGETIWENNFNVWHSDVPDTRVGWSSVVGDPETGNVYALGVCGLFLCIDGKSGETIWSRPLHEELGFLSTYGGRTNFPIVHEGNVIVSAVFIGWGEMAKPNHRFLALDKRTGEVVWFNGTTDLPDDTTYSAPALAVISGVTSLVAGGGDGAIWSIQPRTGKPNWSYGFSRRGLNVPPLVVGDLVFSGHSEEVWDPASSKMGGVVGFQPEGQGALPTDKVLWRNDGMMCGKSAPVLLGDRVYIFEDGGALHILNAKTGEEIPLNIDRKIEKQIKFRNMRSNPLVADGKIYAVSEAGQWLIARPDAEKGLDVVAFSGRDKQIDETYASPIASHGRIYVTTMAGMYCLEDAAKEHGTAEVPAQPAETPAADDPKPAQVQVVPAEVLLRPGEQVKFTARLFNARGQFLREEPYPLYSAKGSGNITPSGKYTAPEDAAHQAVYVTATVGDIEGVARIRVMPDLPYHFDFEKTAIDLKNRAGKPYGDAPVTWVGIRYRHEVREVDGNKLLTKVTTIPKGARSQGFIGRPDMHDYTMQADVMGQLVVDSDTRQRLADEGRQPTKSDGKMPEIGLNVQGYTFAIQGNNQLIQLRTWVTQERLALHPANRNADGTSKCKFAFQWEPNTWYTMKLKVANVGDVAKLYGKVWPRGEAEPDAWTIQCEDPAPQRVGAPGFYGDANFAELYIDNISVTPNESTAAE